MIAGVIMQLLSVAGQLAERARQQGELSEVQLGMLQAYAAQVFGRYENAHPPPPPPEAKP